MLRAVDGEGTDSSKIEVPHKSLGSLRRSPCNQNLVPGRFFGFAGCYITWVMLLAFLILLWVMLFADSSMLTVLFPPLMCFNMNCSCFGTLYVPRLFWELPVGLEFCTFPRLDAVLTTSTMFLSSSLRLILSPLRGQP